MQQAGNSNEQHAKVVNQSSIKIAVEIANI